MNQFYKVELDLKSMTSKTYITYLSERLLSLLKLTS